MPGIENPNWLAYNLGSAEYGRIRQYGRTWQNATIWQNLAKCDKVAEFGKMRQGGRIWQNMAECGNVLLGAGALLRDIWPL